MRDDSVLLKGMGIVPPKYLLLVLRLGLGWLFLHAAVVKLTTEGGWTATGFLTHATEGPLAGLFQQMAGAAAVDWLVMVGELLIGIALVLGMATRVTALAGSAMLALFYLAQLPSWHGWIDSKIVYILVLNILAAARAGTYWGIDGMLESVERRIPQLRFVLG
ncbi:MAG: DoxX family protein [Dehalococcoidia bacterium]